MLRCVGSRTELAVRRKHRPIGQLRHSGTKLWQFRHAVRHNSDESRLNITKWDLSGCNYPGLYIPQRDAESRHAGIHYPRLDLAECDDSGLDFAKRHSEYHYPGLDFAKQHSEYHYPGLDFAKRHSEYHYPRLDIAQWHAEHHDSRIHFAQRDTEHDDPWIDFAANGSG
jgi:hypothetical protein